MTFWDFLALCLLYLIGRKILFAVQVLARGWPPATIVVEGNDDDDDEEKPRAPANWWAVLHVPPTAKAAEIEAAYRALMKRFHPDMPGGSPQLAQAINAARAEGLRSRAR